MATIRIAETRPGPGDGTVTVTVVVRSEQLPPFRIDVRVHDQGSAPLNRNEVRGALQRFLNDFAEALRQPLQFEEDVSGTVRPSHPK